MKAPYIHTEQKGSDHSKNWLVALVPILIWGVFAFGARVLSLCVISLFSAYALDYPARRYLFKYSKGRCVDLMTAVYAVLAVFAMPVTVPLFFPMISSILVVLAKNLSVFRPKMIFNPFVFSAAVLNVAFPSVMTAFSKPFAYFSAFDITIDPKLLQGYRVISPLQYIADGSVYEDGLMAQLYGFASGNIGEIAVAAILLSALWLFLRQELDLTSTAFFVGFILILGLAFPSNDAENNHFAFSILLSGGIAFLAVFALNDRATMPLTSLGKLVVALVSGGLIFVARKFFGGFEWGYAIFLVLSFVSPLIEKVTKPKPITAPKTKQKNKPANKQKAKAEIR